MRGLATFISLVALLIATAYLFAAPRRDIHVSFLVYLPVHILFTAGCWFGEQRLSLSSTAYSRLYVGLGVLELVSVLLVALSLCWQTYAPTIIPFVGLLVCLAVFCARIYGRNSMSFAAFLGATFILAGIAAIVSLGHLESFAWDVSRQAIGIFWITEGIFQYLYISKATRGSKEWITHSAWIPALIAIVAFGWLSLKLNSQREISRQLLPELQLIERRGM